MMIGRPPSAPPRREPTMPTDKRPLSERLLDIGRHPEPRLAPFEYEVLARAVARIRVREAAEQQPEVAELRARADLLRGCDKETVESNRVELLVVTEAHADALVRLAEETARADKAEAALARVREVCGATRERTATRENCRRLLRELTAALGDPSDPEKGGSE